MPINENVYYAPAALSTFPLFGDVLSGLPEHLQTLPFCINLHKNDGELHFSDKDKTVVDISFSHDRADIHKHWEGLSYAHITYPDQDKTTDQVLTEIDNGDGTVTRLQLVTSVHPKGAETMFDKFRQLLEAYLPQFELVCGNIEAGYAKDFEHVLTINAADCFHLIREFIGEVDDESYLEWLQLKHHYSIAKYRYFVNDESDDALIAHHDHRSDRYLMVGRSYRIVTRRLVDA